MTTSSTHQRTGRVPRAAVALLAAGALLVGACGDDDDDAATDEVDGEEFLAGAEPICAERNDDIDAIFEGLFGEEEPTPAELHTALNGSLDRYEGALEEVRDLDSFPVEGDVAKAFADVDAAVDSVRAEVNTPEKAAAFVEAQEDDAIIVAERRLQDLGFPKCGDEDESESFGPDELTAEQRAAATQVAITATEYSFGGVGDQLAAGPVVFTLTNDGGTEHEMGMAKIKDGVTAEDAIAAALADSEDDSYVDSELGGAFVTPGDSIEFTGVLEPGLYSYACFIETDDGESHASLGMIGTVTVAG